jgi:UDP-N-acetylmuramoylalanine--D-glutamate ligase
MGMGFDVAGKHVVVIGAGRSGRAAARLAAARGARVTLSDTDAAAISRESALAEAGVRLEAGPHRDDTLGAADLVVLSPGVPPDQPAFESARRRNVPVIGEVELASRWLEGRIVAITGTKGKSTTTSLTAELLREGGFHVTAGGNLGTALSEQVAESRRDSLHVVEVSSFQLESTDTFHPWIAVLLNLSPDHLDRHASFDAYARAKARVFANQDAGDWAVVNADDPAAMDLARQGRARRFDFSLEARLDDGVIVDGGDIVERRSGQSRRVMPRTEVRLPGRHGLADVLAASAVGLVAGVPASAIARAVAGFRGLEHALEDAGAYHGVRFVNDSKATNVLAARRALESFDGDIVAIMGGRYKGGAFEELSSAVGERVRAIVTIGEASERIAAALGHLTPIVSARSMADAVDRAYQLALPGGVVLLAPACSSFDMFSDYADRGRAFKRAVGALVEGQRAEGKGQREGKREGKRARGEGIEP